jgi:hypothetical protein
MAHTWWIVQIEDRRMSEIGEYGPYRTKQPAQDLADRYNAVVDKQLERNPNAELPRAYAIPLKRRTVRGLVADWGILDEEDTDDF